MDCFEQHGALFDVCQEWHFEVSKRSDNSISILQEGRFADVHEECFQGAKS